MENSLQQTSFRRLVESFSLYRYNRGHTHEALGTEKFSLIRITTDIYFLL